MAIPPMGDGPEVRPPVLDKVDNSRNIVKINVDVSEDEVRQRGQNTKFFAASEENTVSAGGGMVVFVPQSPSIDVYTIEGTGPKRVAERNAAPARGKGIGVGRGPRGGVENGAWVSHGGGDTGRGTAGFGASGRDIDVPTRGKQGGFEAIDLVLVKGDLLVSRKVYPAVLGSPVMLLDASAVLALA